MKSIDKAARKYCKEICNWLPCSGKVKKQIVANIETNLHDYIINHPHATFQDIEKHFGSPKAIGLSYIDNSEPETVLKRMHNRRTVKRIVLTVAAVAILLWGVVVSWAAYEEWNRTHGWSTIVVSEEIQ